MIRNAAIARHRNFTPLLDPDFDDDGWKPALAKPQLHPDYWGAHDYVGVLSADQFPCAGLSLSYRRWREINRQRGRWLWRTPQVTEVVDWYTPEMIEIAALVPPEPEPEVRVSRWPRNGGLMPVLNANEDYEYLRQRYRERFWTVIFGYLNDRIEPWFCQDLERIKRCIVADHD
jgi:hypothetical protein